MIAITLTSRDARQVSKDGVKAISPSSPETSRMLKLFLRVNADMKVLSNALLWNSYDPAKFAEIREKLNKSLATLNEIAQELDNETKALRPKKKANVVKNTKDIKKVNETKKEVKK
jgi:hypothetical protein